MKKVFYSALDAYPGEGMQVLFLLIQGFLLGIFVSTYDVSASAVFLKVFDESDLSLAIASSGLLGIIFTGLYARLQKTVSYSFLSILNQSFIAGLVVVLSTGIYILQNNEVLIFSAFVLLGPLNALAMLNYWGTFSRMFSARQAKRLSGGIDTGQVIATIVGFFSVPIIQQVIHRQEDFLFISSFSLILSVFVLYIIINRFRLHSIILDIENEGARKLTFFEPFKNRYILLMAFFMVISVVISELVDFNFLSVVEIKYQNDQKNMAQFLAYFTGSILLLGFIFQTFFDDKILSMFGIKISLMIMPVLLILFAGLAILVGNILGYQGQSSSFALFFIMIAVLKLITQSLKISLEGRVFKIFYMPLNPGIMLDSKAKIEGVISQFAGLLAGSIIFIFNVFHFFEPIYFQFILIALAAIYIYYIFHLHSEYKNSLHQTLNSGRSEPPNSDKKLLFLLPEEICPENQKEIIAHLLIIQKTDILKFESVARKVYELENPVINAFLENRFFKPNDEQGDWSSGGMEKLEQKVYSGSYKDRMMASRALSEASREHCLKYLPMLMRDKSPQVKSTAILSAGQSRLPQFWPYLLELLNSDLYSGIAASALSECGEAVLPALDQAFYRSDQNTKGMKKILEIFGKVGGPKSAAFLWAKISFPDKTINTIAIKMLGKIGYSVSQDQVIAIKSALDDTIGDIVWNLAVIQTLQQSDSDAADSVQEAIQLENSQNYEFIFLLLAMIFDPASVNTARDNINTGISEKVGFALELMDVFISDDLKPKLFPVLNDSSDAEKIRKLSPMYARPELSYIDTLHAIVNRDYNNISKWTKLTSILTLSKELDHVSDDLIALMFHPDDLIRETAAWSIYMLDAAKYEEVSMRLKPLEKKKLDHAIRLNPLELKFRKLFRLREMKIFKNLNGLLLTEIESFSQIKEYKKKEIIWSSASGDNQFVCSVIKGKLILTSTDKVIKEIHPNESLGEVIAPPGIELNLLVTEGSIICLTVKDKLIELLNEYPGEAARIIHLAEFPSKEISAGANILNSL